MNKRVFLQRRRGMTLPEVMVAVAVLSIALVSMYELSRQLSSLGRLSQLKATAISVAVSQMEIIRNLPYDSVGTDATFPSGPLPSSQTIARNSVNFTVTIGMNFVDDPADGNILGTIVGKPVDTAPADYKKVEVGVCWDSSSCNNPVKLSTLVAPKNLENTSNTGALFISVIDANGQPVSQANVSVTNTAVTPNVNISNHTDTNGKLQLLSLPPATDSYHITISKAGYTSDSTIAVGTYPNLTNPDKTILAAQVTPVTFLIDRVSSLTVQVADSQSCSALSGVQFRLHGTARLLATGPEVYAYDQNLTADGSGKIVVPNLPWDDYTLTMITSTLDTAGVNPPDTITVNAGANVTVSLAAATHQTTTSRIIVRDTGTHAPIADASVRLEDGSGYDQTLTTDQGTIQQSNWDGGAGQTLIGSTSRYFSASGGVTGQRTGHIELERVSTPGTFTEDFSTTTHQDAGNTTTTWSASGITLPQDVVFPGLYVAAAQAQSTTINSTTGEITSATLTATSTLNGQTISLFMTADGVNFEAVTSGVAHTFVYPGSDLRWRASFATSDTTVTPIITNINLDFTQLIMSSDQGTLISSTFDSGQATNFLTLSWNAAIPPSAGTSAVRWQVAANDDNATWNFLGPDGTGSTYFTVSGSSLPASISGHRYLRYKLYLQTADQLVTPEVTAVTIVKNNACTPPGQVFFSPLPHTGSYTLTTTRAGYQTDTRSINLTGNSVEYIDLSP